MQTDQVLFLSNADLPQDVRSSGGGGVQSKCRIHVPFRLVCVLLHQPFIDFVLLLCGRCVLFPSAGKIPFIHVGNQVVSELGPIVQFTKAKVLLLVVLSFICSKL